MDNKINKLNTAFRRGFLKKRSMGRRKNCSIKVRFRFLKIFNYFTLL